MKLVWIALTTALLGTSALATTHVALADEKQEVPMAQLPSAVRDTLAREAGGAKIDKVQQVSDDGKLFRAEIKKEHEKDDLYVDAAGKVVGRHTEK